ncbi:PREDICTED: sirohydrochlorin ferrochelatase, chloroplastic-like isoform X3 [Tarenaya hassleriana]|uniref:sirohydrochlorin ferrochelatase, chloroplastic-like isoform X3 n=1 Tax=Tarenaya hassleriana TaxID=28532 RepID=UPI00053C965C|nr:PREDICTED: sirohydrochlorin ferrochelatase, chloroplastic-like isoform X3 [Tarenaya hassleriana]
MADKITALSQFFINNPQVVPYKWAKNYISSSSVEITRTNRTRALPGSVKFQKLHTKNRQRMCSLSCFATSENVGFFRNGIGDGDGIIIVDHGSHRHESNLMLDEFVKMFKDQTGYPIVEPAHMDIPSLTADVAKEFPGIAYLITAPLGLHNLLVDVVNDRIKHCLGHAQGDADECEVCAGTGKCKLYNAA